MQRQNDHKLFCSRCAHWSLACLLHIVTLLRLLCTVTQPTGYKEEAERLAQAGVLVDTFFLSSRAADPNFVEIANLTKGTAYSLNICTAAGAQDLIDAVTPRRAVPTLDSHTSIGDERNCGRTKNQGFISCLLICVLDIVIWSMHYACLPPSGSFFMLVGRLTGQSWLASTRSATRCAPENSLQNCRPGLAVNELQTLDKRFAQNILNVPDRCIILGCPI